MYLPGEINVFLSEKLIKKFGERKVLLITGVGFILFGIVFFLAYILLPASTVESYYQKEIFYNSCDYKDSQYGSWIILQNEEAEYTLPGKLWAKTYSQEFVLKKLREMSQCTVWLHPKYGNEIKGISANDLFVDPAMGAYWDNRDRKLMLYSKATSLIPHVLNRQAPYRFILGGALDGRITSQQPTLVGYRLRAAAEKLGRPIIGLSALKDTC